MAEYIEREEVLAAVERWETIFVPSATHRLIDLVKRIPAADVRPVVRARWNTVKYPLYECSNCGAVYQDVGYGFNFCPNCGADMRKES